jgi:hypothetical protein
MTVHDARYNLLRRLELTTIFGNPGIHRAAIPEKLSERFSICTWSAGGVGRIDGRWVLAVHKEAGTGEFT